MSASPLLYIMLPTSLDLWPAAWDCFLTPDNKIYFCANPFCKHSCWAQLWWGRLGTNDWLREDSQSFLVWTDYCTLEYLCSAKTWNCCQARGTLIYSHFHLHLSYRPGSKNTKPDAPSRPLSARRGERNWEWKISKECGFGWDAQYALQFCMVFSCEVMVTTDHTMG